MRGSLRAPTMPSSQPQAAAGESLIAVLFAHLADGGFHSGEALAHELGVSRSAIWKAARTLRQLGTPVNAVRNRGYQLAACAEPLDAARIAVHLSPLARDKMRRLETVWSVGSTNTTLMQHLPPVGRTDVLLAEHQTAGRGRQGRSWLAPPGGAICLSLSWTFAQLPRDLGALGLVIGVCALRGLRSFGLHDIRLKWPNDLLVQDRKLGGILIELRAEAAGPASVVIGIGVNVALGRQIRDAIRETGLLPSDLMTAGLAHPTRNAVTAALVSACLQGLVDFEKQGLKPFVQEWLAADALRSREIVVRTVAGEFAGVARGIDVDGALLVETPQELMRFVSGDASVRPV